MTVWPRTTRSLALLSFIAWQGLSAQGGRQVDSLLATWPVRECLTGPGGRHDPGVVPAVRSEHILTGLQRAAPGLPLFVDSAVTRWADLYGEPRREHFRALLGMAGIHFPMIERELARHGLPQELKHLPMALSAMNPLALSADGGAGLWMLDMPVALRHGLVVDATVDERHDPARSTVAAMHRLKELHALHGTWPGAVMAFAAGPANLERARQRGGGATEPRTLYPHFGRERRDILPLLMAFTYLTTNAVALGIDPLPIGLAAADTVRHDSTLSLRGIAEALGMPASRMRSLNPALVGRDVPAGTPIMVPYGQGGRFHQKVHLIAAKPPPPERRPAVSAASGDPAPRLTDGREAITYRIVAGDCLGCIADRFGVGITELRKWNDLRGDQIDVGNTLTLYVPPKERVKYEGDTLDREAPVQRTDTVRAPPKPPPANDPFGFTWYTVKPGDSLYNIAKDLPGVSAEDLMEFNGISANIRPGQRIKVPKKR